MTNTQSVHVVITGFLGILVMLLACFAFYVFRSLTMREQTFSDAMKVIKAATDIVASIAERGIPVLRGRIEELESRGRAVEQNMRKTGSVLESLTRVVGSNLPVESQSSADPVANEKAMLEARRAARTVQQAA